MYNKVTLIGRLTKNPEIRNTTTGMSVCTFSLAVNRDKDHTDFFNLVGFGKTAEICSTYLTKGKLIFVEGTLRINTYEKDGVRHQRPEIVIGLMKMLSPKDKTHSDVSEVKPEHYQSESYGVEEIPF